eukprot:1100866-Ditylum_brightwellii.AAC.1
MAKVIRDGPIELAGAAMTRLIDVQDSQATPLAKIAVAWAQQQCGWHELILTDMKTVFPHFKACWLKSL